MTTGVLFTLNYNPAITANNQLSFTGAPGRLVSRAGLVYSIGQGLGFRSQPLRRNGQTVTVNS